jgi:two-component system, cell cycle sensor histidine kinase and response regulator CckA
MTMRPGNGETILVVDDEEAVVEMVTSVLERGGYRTIGAASSADAIEAFDREHGSVAAVVTDVMMPTGDGRLLIPVLRERSPFLRVLTISGLPPHDLERQSLAWGADASLPKPFTPQELLETLGQLLAND